MPKIMGLVFDKDGTLFDFNATWGTWAAQMLRKEAGGDKARLIGLAGRLGFDLTVSRFLPHSVAIAGTIDEIADTMLSERAGQSRSALIERLVTGAAEIEQIEAVPLAAYFAGLAEHGYKLGIATNDSEQSTFAHLDQSGSRGHFDFIAGYDSGFGAKPEPGQLQAFCDHIDLDPSRCAMIGDSMHDLRAGRAAGMTTIAVLTGPAPHDTLAPMADIVLPSIADIPGWLGR